MNASFYMSNRRRLIERVQTVVVLGAHTKIQQRSDMSYKFLQEPNFWYLTGIDEPDWLLVIVPDGKDFLVQPEREASHIVFDGANDVKGITEQSGINTVFDNTSGMREIRRLASHHSLVYTIDHPRHSSHYDFALNPSIALTKRLLERTFEKVQDCTKELNSLRAVKQPVEVSALRRAIDLTTKTFSEVREHIKDYSYEYEIEAAFTHAFRSSGSIGHAYEPIVANAGNACTLHYNDNSMRMKPRTLVLLDIGASVDGYAADITRTYAYKHPTKRQVEVHEAVEKAHHRIISLLSPLLSVESYQRSVDEIMTETLRALRLYKDENSLRTYFPHSIGHGLGIDVHDSLGGPKTFQEGMVLTVEPGIYIPEEEIGVRIEDDILITAKGYENLSESLSTAL